MLTGAPCPVRMLGTCCCVRCTVCEKIALCVLTVVKLILRWAGKVVTKACCQYWCSTCLLLKIVSALPHLPKCSCCNCELSTVQSTDFEDNGDTVVRTATFQEKYKWRVAERVRAWLKKPAEERRG